MAPRRTAAASRAAYHHGDLSAALLAAAEDILAESGVEGFTLRACARRAGVSHAAPAHHFGDAAGLLSELSALGFEGLTQAMAAARAEAGADPRVQLRATGLAYIRYAVTHRARFQLMFRSDRTRGVTERLRQTGHAAFAVLEEVVAAAVGPAGVTAGRLALAWSTVHGFACLLIEERLGALTGGEGDPIGGLGGAMLDAMMVSFVAEAREAGPPDGPGRKSRRRR